MLPKYAQWQRRQQLQRPKEVVEPQEVAVLRLQ
jgi:hypothetical protein